MSRVVGNGYNAVLVAGGLDAPEAVERDAAAREIVLACYLYGIPGPRGWSSATWAALKVLHPQAAAHYEAHEDWRLTLDTFWPGEEQ